MGSELTRIGDLKNEKIIPYTSSEEQICVSNCKICQSEFRAEIEEYFDSTNNLKNLHRWVRGTYQIDISYPAVRNHIIYHYQASQKYKFLEGYSGEIKQWIDIGQDPLSSLRKKKAILEKELVSLGAESEELKNDSKLRHIELMNKISNTLLAYDSKIEEIEKKAEPARLIMNQLSIILKDEAMNSNSPEVKVVLSNILDKLDKTIGHLVDFI